MSDIQEQEEDFHIEKASKWTVYFLIDLRVLFIISYVYISVIYLISTTANSEANADINSMQLFNITSLPNHTNVKVSYIDDALLWSCRNLSVTKSYYKYLYIMLFTAFAVTMMFLVITKLTILFGNRAGISHLWKIAAVQYLRDSVQTIPCVRPVYITDPIAISAMNVISPDSVVRDHDSDNNPDLGLAKRYLNLLKKYESKRFFTDKVCNKSTSKSTEKQKLVSQITYFNRCRLVNIFISVIYMLIIVSLAFMSYDLHALSCIAETSDEFIDYDPFTNTVELRYSDNMKSFQQTIVFFILMFSLLYLLNAGSFYLCNSIIIKNMKPLVRIHFNDDQIQYDGTDV